MTEFLFELYSEEIPARMQLAACRDLQKLFQNQLQNNELTFESIKTFVTPMRLGIVIDGLPIKQPNRIEEKKGPNINAPEKALQGFLNSTNLTLDQCEIKMTPKGKFYFAVQQIKGQATAEILPIIINDILAKFTWPKSMRWNIYNFRWVRPLHHILAIFNGEKLKGELDLGGKKLLFSNKTKGHRFMAPQTFEVNNYNDYRQKLYKAYVILDQEERKKLILKGIDNKLKNDLKCQNDDILLDELAGITEWPEIYIGKIDQNYMSIPKEILMTAMRVHQNYFSVLDKNNNLAPYFITVTNTKTSDGGQKIIEGNENILKSRLFDAKFYWDQDLKNPLNKLREKLKGIIFHAKLGTLYDKSARISLLSEFIGLKIGADSQKAKKAAGLAKSDLASGMVFEFPELQAIMGRYYAINDGEDIEIADAIAEHYAPLGPQDICPEKKINIAVAMADKIDTLVGFFGIKLTPTGSKDPFALRRAALGVIRLILENNLRISLAEIFAKSVATYPNSVQRDPEQTINLLMVFFIERLKVYLKEQGIRHDYISAIFKLQKEYDLTRLINRVNALKKFVESDAGKHLLAIYKRSGNIIKIEEKKTGENYRHPIEKDLFIEKEEKDLYCVLVDISRQVSDMIDEELYHDAMNFLIKLREPLDTFFDHITVNSNEKKIRDNRLRLLSQIVATFEYVADLKEIEG